VSAPAPVLAIFSFKRRKQVSIQSRCHTHHHLSSRVAAETHQLLHLLIRQAGNAIHGAIRKAKRVGLDAGFAFSATGLLGGARLVVSALAADEPVAAPSAVAARRVRHAYVCVTIRVLLVCEICAAAARVSLAADAPAAWDLLTPVSSDRSVSKRKEVSRTAFTETLNLPLLAELLNTQHTLGLMPAQPTQPPSQPLAV
jgi:hypothetical protein